MLPNQKEAIHAANLKQIRRADACAERVMFVCSHAGYYEFNPTEKRWRPTNMSGPLFLYLRSGESRFSLLLADVDSLVLRRVPLSGSMGLRHATPYICISSSGAESTVGVWVQDHAECLRLFTHLQLVRCMQTSPIRELMLTALQANAVHVVTPLVKEIGEERSKAPAKSVTERYRPPPRRLHRSDDLPATIIAKPATSDNIYRPPARCSSSLPVVATVADFAAATTAAVGSTRGRAKGESSTQKTAFAGTAAVGSTRGRAKGESGTQKTAFAGTTKPVIGVKRVYLTGREGPAATRGRGGV